MTFTLISAIKLDRAGNNFLARADAGACFFLLAPEGALVISKRLDHFGRSSLDGPIGLGYVSDIATIFEDRNIFVIDVYVFDMNANAPISAQAAELNFEYSECRSSLIPQSGRLLGAWPYYKSPTESKLLVRAVLPNCKESVRISLRQVQISDPKRPPCGRKYGEDRFPEFAHPVFFFNNSNEISVVHLHGNGSALAFSFGQLPIDWTDGEVCCHEREQRAYQGLPSPKPVGDCFIGWPGEPSSHKGQRHHRAAKECRSSAAGQSGASRPAWRSLLPSLSGHVSPPLVRFPGLRCTNSTMVVQRSRVPDGGARQ